MQIPMLALAVGVAAVAWWPRVGTKNWSRVSRVTDSVRALLVRRPSSSAINGEAFVATS